MKPQVLSNLSYGIYAIGTKDAKRPNACIVNTVMQISKATPSDAPLVALSMNRENYSFECIEKSGVCLLYTSSGFILHPIDVKNMTVEEGLQHFLPQPFSIWILPTGGKPGNPCSRSLAGLGLQQDAFTACSKRSKPALSTHFGQARFRRSKPSPPSPKI